MATKLRLSIFPSKFKSLPFLDELLKKFTVIGGNASEELAKKIAKKLNAVYLKSNLRIFPSPSGKIRKLDFKYTALSFFAIFFANSSEALPPITVNFFNSSSRKGRLLNFEGNIDKRSFVAITKVMMNATVSVYDYDNDSNRPIIVIARLAMATIAMIFHFLSSFFSSFFLFRFSFLLLFYTSFNS